jgi:hypothetical protein
MPLIRPCRRRRFDTVFTPFASSFVFFRQPFAIRLVYSSLLLLSGPLFAAASARR